MQYSVATSMPKLLMHVTSRLSTLSSSPQLSGQSAKAPNDQSYVIHSGVAAQTCVVAGAADVHSDGSACSPSLPMHVTFRTSTEEAWPQSVGQAAKLL